MHVKRSYSEAVEFVDERQIGADVAIVMSNVNERLEQLRRKHSLEVSTIAFHAEQEPQSAERVSLPPTTPQRH